MEEGMMAKPLDSKIEDILSKPETPYLSKFDRLKLEFEEIKSLARLSLSGDAEAREKLDGSDEQIKDLIQRLDDFQKDSFDCYSNAEVITMLNVLESSLGVECFKPIKSIGDLSLLPDIGSVIEENGKHYVPYLVAMDTNYYGSNCKEALSKLENDQTAILFTGEMVVKKLGVIYKVDKSQLNKARTREELEVIVDTINAKNIRTVKERECGYDGNDYYREELIQLEALIDHRNDIKELWEIHDHLNFLINKIIKKVKKIGEQNDTTK